MLKNMTYQERKERPMARGCLDYFPDALAEVAYASYIGHKQHSDATQLKWMRKKSTDHEDCLIRHLARRGNLDSDGVRESAKVAWRALAILQLEIEADEALQSDIEEVNIS